MDLYMWLPKAHSFKVSWEWMQLPSSSIPVIQNLTDKQDTEGSYNTCWFKELWFSCLVSEPMNPWWKTQELSRWDQQRLYLALLLTVPEVQLDLLDKATREKFLNNREKFLNNNYSKDVLNTSVPGLFFLTWPVYAFIHNSCKYYRDAWSSFEVEVIFSPWISLPDS